MTDEESQRIHAFVAARLRQLAAEADALHAYTLVLCGGREGSLAEYLVKLSTSLRNRADVVQKASTP
jgi:hypothetical protein